LVVGASFDTVFETGFDTLLGADGLGVIYCLQRGRMKVYRRGRGVKRGSGLSPR
jgi:hypothetical protein